MCESVGECVRCGSHEHDVCYGGGVWGVSRVVFGVGGVGGGGGLSMVILHIGVGVVVYLPLKIHLDLLIA